MFEHLVQLVVLFGETVKPLGGGPGLEQVDLWWVGTEAYGHA